MDHEQRTKVSEQLNPEWAARVVRNIGAIEADFFHASWFLSERMMSEALLAIEKVVTPPWTLVENEWMPQVVCPEWKMARGVGTGDMWLQLSEISHDEDEHEHTWISGVAGGRDADLNALRARYRKLLSGNLSEFVTQAHEALVYPRAVIIPHGL